MFDTAPFDNIRYDTPRGIIQLLQAYISSSSMVSALISLTENLISIINGVTQISPFLMIQKSLTAVIQSSTSFVSGLIVGSKQFLNAIISTSTAFVSNLTAKYAITSVLSGKTQILSFVSIKKVLQGSIVGQTIFVATSTFWNRVKKLTATWEQQPNKSGIWQQKNEEVGTWRKIK